MNRIGFDDKVDARVLGGARINKVIADDMNQIKTAINILADSGADLPSFSTAERNLISPAPVLGYRIYNTTENRGEYYTSAGWLPFMGLKDVHAGSSPNFPASLRGDILRVTANGRLGGVNGLSVFAGDLVYCYTASAGGDYATVGGNFKRIGLPPSLTTVQIDALTQPQEVGLVYDTDLNVMKFYNGVLWLAMVAMFFGDEYEVFASTPTAGQLFYATDTNKMYYGDGITHNAIVTGDCVCPKKYLALIEQTGTGAPTATVILNTTGATVTFGYIGVGHYSVTFSSPVLTSNKTVCRISPVRNELHYSGIYELTNDSLEFFTADGVNTPDNDLLDYGSTIEFLIYP